MSAIFLVQFTLLALVTTDALFRGGNPEKAVALILLGWLLIDPAYHLWFETPAIYGVVDIWHSAMELTALALLLAIALKVNRIWTLWICSLQLVSTLAHLVRMLDPQIDPIIYAWFQQTPFWLQIALVSWGTMRQSRLRREGAAPPHQ